MGAMMGHVSCTGEFAKLSVGSDRTKVTNTGKNRILVRVIKRSSTRLDVSTCEALKCEHFLDPGESAHGDNDMAIVDAAQIETSNGMDYHFRVYPDASVERYSPEVFQIVFDDSKHTYFPDVKLVASAKELELSSEGANVVSVDAQDFDAKLKGLAEEIEAIRLLCKEETISGTLASRIKVVEERKVKLLEELIAADEAGMEFHDALDDEAALRAGCDAETSAICAPSQSRISALVRTPQEWWGEADCTRMTGLGTTSLLMDTRIFHKPSRRPAPWSEGQSDELYTEMGLRDPLKSYIVVWMLLGNAAILTTSEVTDQERFRSVLRVGAKPCLDRCFKLVLEPIQVSSSCKSILPASATDPKVADFMSTFLGTSGCSMHCARTSGGAEYACLMMDFNCAGMVVSYALKKVGFREGHILDLHVVDWSAQALFASGRLNITPEVSQKL